MNRRKRRPLRDYIFALLILILLGYVVYLTYDIFHKEEIARRTASQEKQKLDELNDRYATLEKNLEDLDTERGQEASYRDQFGVALPGEEVIIVVSAPPEAPQSGLSWWRRLLGRFGL